MTTRASVTGKHLCRLFRGSLGYPPLATFRLLKMQLAMALLGRSNLSVKEIAERCGFDNPLYFTRIFTRLYQAPPTAIRTRLRRGQAPPAQPSPARDHPARPLVNPECQEESGNMIDVLNVSHSIGAKGVATAVVLSIYPFNSLL
jgi:hypothetical protein